MQYEKNQTHFQIETRFTRDYFLWRKDLWQRMFKIFSFYQFNKWNCIQYIFISRGAVLLMG